MARSRSGTVPLSYRGLTPTYSTAAVEFARLDRTTESNPPLAVASSTMPAQRSASASQNAAISGQVQHGQKNSIRFCAHHDGRSQRPSLQFNAISRVMPSEAAVIKVGRYSEREEKNTGRDQNMGTTGPVGFKSKVVSRRHCEFWCQGGQWFIKDCASSSGTFLNHIRLSQPNVESRPFPVNDGDVIQLGIDFKGGEEAIFRCVKIRVETNRGWQNVLNNFKKVSDLEADVDEPVGVRNWEDDDDDEKEDDKAKTTEPEQANSNGSTAAVTGDQQNGNPTPASPFGDWIQADAHLTDEIQTRLHITGEANTDGNNLTEHTGNQDDPNNNELGPSGDAIEWTPERPGVPIVGADRQLDAGQNGQANDGPLTPRNTAGPFVFDGSAGGQADVPNSDILGP
ncbi:MAG: hypothetical protein M1814_003096 [Vezdaea aestivalis]|nr:MAG: hypothetical protein M1814_003096 [Vezdaea aestivalis]